MVHLDPGDAASNAKELGRLHRRRVAIAGRSIARWRGSIAGRPVAIGWGIAPGPEWPIARWGITRWPVTRCWRIAWWWVAITVAIGWRGTVTRRRWPVIV